MYNYFSTLYINTKYQYVRFLSCARLKFVVELPGLLFYKLYLRRLVSKFFVQLYFLLKIILLKNARFIPKAFKVYNYCKLTGKGHYLYLVLYFCSYVRWVISHKLVLFWVLSFFFMF